MSFFTDAEKAWTDGGGAAPLAPVMAAIAAAESTSGTQVYGDRAYSGTGAPSSFGWWQIHTFDANGPVNTLPNGQAYDYTRLATDPTYNAQAAVRVLTVQGLGAWTTFRDGSWAAHFPGGKAAALAALAASPLATSSAAQTQEASLSGSGTYSPAPAANVGGGNAAPLSGSASTTTKTATPGLFGPLIDAAGSLAQELFLGTIAVAFIAGGITWLAAVDGAGGAPRITLGATI